MKATGSPLNGTKGLVYEGQLPLIATDLNSNKSYKDLMKLVDKTKVLGVRTNADTPKDAAQALAFFWCRRYRSLQNRTHVLWRRQRPTTVPAAQDDYE